jgi:hypothetical protein
VICRHFARGPTGRTRVFFDHWRELGADINKHGVVGGVFDGTGGSAVKTGQDFAHVGESIWPGITSIF